MPAMQPPLHPMQPPMPRMPPPPPPMPRMGNAFREPPAAPAAQTVPAVQAAAAAEVAALHREVERLTATLAAVTEEKERLARAPAAPAADSVDEIERVKERLSKEAAREIEQHKRDLARDFIEVLDDLDRAVQAPQGSAGASTVADGVREGVELVRKNFRSKLAQLGVERDPALGMDFDPARHEAVSVLPVRDPAKDGMIVDVVREGYRMGDDVLRPALVVVARAS
jgi:molecular chaperone GrpE